MNPSYLFFLLALNWAVITINARTTLPPPHKPAPTAELPPPPSHKPTLPLHRSPPPSPLAGPFGNFTIDGAYHFVLRPAAVTFKRSGTSNRSGARVAYGRTASPGQFPFATFVSDINGDFVCSGSLIAPRVVLTAGHCVLNDNFGTFVDNIGSYTVSVGVVDDLMNYTGTLVSVTVPKTRDSDSLYGDLALIEVASASPMAPVRLATTSTSLSKVSSLTALGWGLNQSGKQSEFLQYATLPTITNLTQCRELHYQFFSSPLPVDHMCVGLSKSWTSTCEGDSGGPYLIPGSPPLQVALVSYGPSLYTCGDHAANNLDVPTSVIYWSTWIQDVLSLYNLNGVGAPVRLNTVVPSACFTSPSHRTLTTATVGQCCEYCRADTVCKAWTWTQNNQQCGLKSAAGEHSINQICTSGTIT